MIFRTDSIVPKLNGTLHNVERVLRYSVGKIYFWCYLFLITLVCCFFEVQHMLTAVSFLLINYFISFVLISTNLSGEYRALFYLIHAVYTLVYIFKAIILKIIGLNTDYIYQMIKVVITDATYFDGLVVVTVGHIVIFSLFLLITSVSFKVEKNLREKNYMANNFLNILLILIFLWILFSSFVMFKFGVAVMGTESVSLPFRLSGIFFYSRKLILPLVLLYCLEKAIVGNSKMLFISSLLIYITLAISDVLVRASKGPLLQLTLFMAFLYLILKLRNINVSRMINMKHIICISLIALLAFPLTEVYRSTIMSQGVDFGVQLDSYLESSNVHSGGNILTISLERLFHRLVGFTQMVGLLNDNLFQHNLAEVFEYSSLARYYTEYYLGYEIEGNLSSPSLLGISIILGGKFWFCIFAGYVFIMILLWKCMGYFVHFEIPIKCLLAYEAFNTIMAGTIDASLNRIFFIVIVSIILEYIFLSGKHKESVFEASNKAGHT